MKLKVPKEQAKVINPKKSLLSARIMWGGLLIGLAGIAGYCLWTADNKWNPAKAQKLTQTAAILLAAIPLALAARWFLWKKSRENGRLSLRNWQAGNLLLWAACMGVGVITVRFMVTTHVVWPMALVAAAAGFMIAATFPSPRQFDQSAGKLNPLPVIVAMIFLFAVAAYCGLFPPPEKAAPPEALSPDPKRYLPENEKVTAYRAELEQSVKIMPSVEVKVYGLQPGVPTADGWRKITSTGAGFSVLSPGEMMDERVIVYDNDGLGSATDKLKHEGKELLLVATRIRQADGQSPNLVEDMMKGAKGQASYTVKEITVAGKKAYEMRGPGPVREGKPSLMFGRMMEANGAFWYWTAYIAEEDREKMLPIVERYLNSYEIPAVN